MSVAERFGDNLRRCRKAADLSREEVASRADLNRTQFAVLERGERLPRIDTLLKLAAAVEASPNELLKGMVWTPGRIESGRFLDG